MDGVLAQILGSFLGGGLALSLLAFFGREWIVLRLKDAIEREALVRRTVFEIKRDACLEALGVIDAAFSQREWKLKDGTPLKTLKQRLDISKARACHNKLALTCENPKVIDLYMTCLGFKTSDKPPVPPTDSMIALRNTMREELGFGASLDLNRESAFIGSLDGAEAV